MGFATSNLNSVVSQSINLILKVKRMKSSDTIVTGDHKVPHKHERQRIRIPVIQKEQQFHVNSDGSAAAISEEISDVCLWKCTYAIHDLMDEGDLDRAVAILRELIEVALHG